MPTLSRISCENNVMRVLHLFSNSKWTGPAEPALNLCAALRHQGVEVSFACAHKTGSGFNKIVATAKEMGIVPLDFLYLSKHRHPLKNLWDVRALRRYLRNTPCDLLHCHLDNDHEIAVQAAAGTGIPIVRSNHLGCGFPNDRRHRILLAHTMGVIEPSEMARTEDTARFTFDAGRLFVVHGAVDRARFDPTRSLPDMRREMNIPPDALVLGIVARMQMHRHYEDLFEAFAAFAAHAPDARLVVVGRGTRQEQVGFLPVQKLGLAERVHFTGYLDGDAYVGMLRAFDAGFFLVPGTDGTCRAAREIMAMGKAMIVADRGMLRELVVHEREGIVTDGSAEELCRAMTRLHAHSEECRQLGENARQKAIRHFTLENQSMLVADAYRNLLAAAAT